MNNVVLIGRLTNDPTLRYIPNTGTAVSNFTLAVDRGLSKEKKLEMEKKNIPTADFIRITMWGKQGENAATYLAKGRLVGVQGKIQTSSYTKDDGTRTYNTEIVATVIEFIEGGVKRNNNTSNDFTGMEGFHPVDNEDIPF